MTKRFKPSSLPFQVKVTYSCTYSESKTPAIASAPHRGLLCPYSCCCLDYPPASYKLNFSWPVRTYKYHLNLLTLSPNSRSVLKSLTTDPGSNPLKFTFVFSGCGLWTVFSHSALHSYSHSKRANTAAHLKADSFWWWHCGVRYRLPLSLIF